MAAARFGLVIALVLAGNAATFAEAPLERALRSVVSILPVMPPERFRAEEPEGSGVVVGSGQHIVTALHVVNGAEAIFVRSADGDIVEARMHGSDPYTDLALLEIEEAMPPARLGGDPPLGARVCAVGNAFGLDLSVSCGVISGVHRTGVGFNRVEDFHQTDAAVNPGASGGALVNETGQVVGILSAIFTQESDANIGVNFAVAVPLAARVIDSLIAGQDFRPPTIGVTLERDPQAGEPGRLAAIVSEVTSDSAAAAAGFRDGDRIVRAGPRRVRKPSDFVSAIARLEVDQTIEVEIERSGRSVELTLVIPEHDDPGPRGGPD